MGGIDQHLPVLQARVYTIRPVECLFTTPCSETVFGVEIEGGVQGVGKVAPASSTPHVVFT